MSLESEYIQPTFYVGIVVIELSVGVTDDKPMYEERFLFVKGASEQEAKQKVLDYVSQPLSYQNQYGETVTWSFKELIDVRQMMKDEIVEGTELFSRFFGIMKHIV